MKEYYTYAYLREDRTPYYVGKGTGRRAYHSHPRVNGKQVPLPKDKDNILILKRFDDEQKAFLHETYMIHLFGRKCDGGILINLSLGGGGTSLYKTDEERKCASRQSALKYYYEKVGKDAAKMYRRKQLEDPEYRQKMYEYEKEWRKSNPEKCVEKRKRYYEKNKELLKQKRREYYHRTKNKTISNETQ